MVKLTEREEDVIRLAAKGYNNDQIARELFISETTVRTHLSNVYQKYCVSGPRRKHQYATRIRAVLIYLGLAKPGAWGNE